MPALESSTETKIAAQLAVELGARPAQVHAAVSLLDGGATVPFIARYRKEATAGLDDTQLRELETRLAYLRELEVRRAAVVKSIAEQGKLTPALQDAIDAAPTKQELEDLYAPYKAKRRTKGAIAREAGLEPLAERLLGDPSLDPWAEAAAFVNADAGFADVHAVLDGVRDLLAERWAEDAALVGGLREWLWAEGLFVSRRAARTRTPPRSPSSATTSTMPSRSHACHRTVLWRCSVGGRWKYSMCTWRSMRPSLPGKRAWPRAASHATSAGATRRAPATS